MHDRPQLDRPGQLVDPRRSRRSSSW
jgi:hypothetical protein